MDNSYRIYDNNGVTVSSDAATKNNSLILINIFQYFSYSNKYYLAAGA